MSILLVEGDDNQSNSGDEMVDHAVLAVNSSQCQYQSRNVAGSPTRKPGNLANSGGIGKLNGSGWFQLTGTS